MDSLDYLQILFHSRQISALHIFIWNTFFAVTKSNRKSKQCLYALSNWVGVSTLGGFEPRKLGFTFRQWRRFLYRRVLSEY